MGFVHALAERTLAERRPGTRRDLLTTGEAGLVLGLSDQTVRNWVAAGRLPAVKRGVRTLIPWQAVQDEIERSRVHPAPGVRRLQEAAASLAWRKQLLDALPGEVVERLNALHEQLESGRELSAEEEAEMVRLERDMADAAARHLREVIRRRRAGAA